MNIIEAAMGDDMRLPPGSTCSQCNNYMRCLKFFGCSADATTCDWSPSRFSAKKTGEQLTKELGFGEGEK